jgi:hypothetical protein
LLLIIAVTAARVARPSLKPIVVPVILSAAQLSHPTSPMKILGVNFRDVSVVRIVVSF